MRLVVRIMWSFCGLTLLVLAAAYISQPTSVNNQIAAADYEHTASNYHVEILRDSLGIPHIYGDSDADAAFGLAYAHAEDDFQTIQDVILATRGSLAAEKGVSAVKTDYLSQWMGIWPAVNGGYNQLPLSTRKVAQAYADGLNHYAAQNQEKVSRFLLPVTGKDLVAGFTFKTPMFYGFDEALGELLDPDAPHEIAKTGDTALSWRERQSLPTGSQGIAVAPHRSNDGATRLLINSHQPLTGPVAWYEARVHSNEGWNMAGATFPGSPVIIHGHNQYLGWANTVNKPDLVDIYKLTTDPKNPQQYLLDGQWKKFEKQNAKIRVKLFGPLHWTFNKEILISDHGPVFETDYGTFAVRWAGMGEIRTLDFMLAINKATNKFEFENALKLSAMPSINYVYADGEGNIGLYYNAMFPERIEGWDWSKYLPGDKSELIWHSYRDFKWMPKTLNPKSGLVYNANNPPFHSTDGDDDAHAEDFPLSMGIETVVTNRALQIEHLYGAKEKISAQDFEQLKYDNRYNKNSYQIKALTRWLKSDKPTSLQQEPYAAALNAISNWNLDTQRENKIAALAILTMEPIRKAKGARVSDEIVENAFQQAVDKLMQVYGDYRVRYGDVNRHVRGDKSWGISGGPDVLRAVYGAPLDEKGHLANRAGDSYIMMVEWDDEGNVSSRAVHNFGSATRDVNSRHFSDQAEMFAEEKLRPVYFSRDLLEANYSRRYTPNNPSRNEREIATAE